MIAAAGRTQRKSLIGSTILWTWALYGCALLCGSPAEPTRLREGEAVEREIAGGANDLYGIRANSGQLIYLQVDQRAADVRVTLAAPDGSELALSDFVNFDRGPETIAVIAASAGDYTVKVAQPDAKAAQGKYEIRLMALRDATEADRERAGAEVHVARAEALRRQRTAASRASAITEYEQALPFFVAAGERYREALILNTAGLTYAQLGNLKEALPRYQRAVQLFQELGDRPMEARATNNAGGAFDVLGDVSQALRTYERALTLFRSVGNRAEEANTLNNVAKLYGEQGERQKAIETYLQALPALQQAGAARMEAVVLGNLGTNYNVLGEYETARDYLTKSLDRWKASGDQTGQAPTLDNLGTVSLNQGQTASALRFFEESLAAYRTRGDRRGEAVVLTHLADCVAQQGDTAKAIESLEKSIAISRALGDRRFEALALMEMAMVLSDSGQSRKALDFANQALESFRAIGDRNSESKTLVAIAGAQRNLGNLPEARQRAEEALAVIEQARGGIGTGETRASYLATRSDAYSLAIDLQMETHDEPAAVATSERAHARSLLEMLAESGNAIREGVDLSLLAREKELTDALNARGARLLPLMGRETPQTAALSREIRELETEYQQVEAAIRKSSPHYAALTQPSPLQLKQIQDEVLDADSLLLEYALGEKRSFLWAVSRTAFRTWALPARAVIELQANEVGRLIVSHADAPLGDAMRRLSDMILTPAASMLPGKRLVIVADGALQRLPFAALPLPGSREPLITEHEVVTLPSASAIAVLRHEIVGREPAPKGVAVFADPVFDASGAPRSEDATRVLAHLEDTASAAATALKIPRLPYTAQEADQILRVARGMENWKATGLEASRAAAVGGRLGDYRYVHFATHGFLDVERPSLSALVLAQVDRDGQPVDGFLRVNDIYNTRLTADLVVLSACQTGLGKEVRGEGLMGLTRAFLYAGSPRVIVSLWNVNDRATAELMASLYRGMLREGKSPAAALRSAQMEMRKKKQWASPYYWAAFVQTGEWK